MSGTGNLTAPAPAVPDQSPTPRFAVAQPLLVGVDSSEGSRHALAWAAAMARMLHQRAVALHAFSPWVGIGMAIPPFDYDQYRDAVESEMAEWTRPLNGIEHAERIVEDDPADGLLTAGRKLGSGMIVVGAHSRGDRLPRMLGSVTSKLLHISEAPVAVVPQTAGTGPPAGHIVVGVDGSASSLEALKWGATWASALGLGVHAVCAYPMDAYSEKPRLADVESVDAMDKTLCALRDLAHEVSDEERVEATVEVVIGHPAEKLIDAGRDEFALVVGRKGHSTFAEVVFGSTSRNCATHSPVPVVVVP
jgi:nucleotide-binding universal stress UspA family protein